MKRSLTTNERVNQLISKDEPSFVGMMELDKIEITLALNWYSQHREKEQSHRYLAEYCKANGLKVSAQQIELQVSTLGFVCRMMTRGAILDKKSRAWLGEKLEAMKAPSVRDALFDAQKEPTPVAVIPKPATIQDHIKSQSSKCMGDLEAAIDEFILSDFKKIPDTLAILREHDMKGVHGPNIVNFFKRYRDEFSVAIAGKDEQMNEGYRNYTVPEMKKMYALYDEIISNTLTVMGEAVAAREPRAKKPRTPEKQIKTLKFCAKDDKLGFVSVPALRIVGSESLWSYHRNSRVLTRYVADDAAGLMVRGSAIKNYSLTKSCSKKLRKPDQILPQIVGGGKVFLKNVMEQLTTKEGKVTGRINKETLLLRVIV